MTLLELAPYDRWLAHVARWRHCQECPLCEQRNHIVLARGDVPADIVFCGEAPGISEDTSGLPFDGPAGQLLDQIVFASLHHFLGVRTAFTNVVCCFPADAKRTDNHQPEEDEVLACRPRLVEFVGLCRPSLVVCVGALATKYLPSLDSVDGRPVEVVSVVHPSAILRMPAAQKDMAVRKVVATLREAIERVMIPF